MILTYLIYPLLGIIAIAIGYVIAKKNNLMSNKKLMVYLLLSTIILAVPAALGFLNYQFMPYGYLSLATLYLVAGYFNSRILKWIFKEQPSYVIELSIYILTMTLGMVLFSFIFNYCNELQYGLWASTALISYIVPCLYTKTNQLFIDIPVEIYNMWSYTDSADTENSETIDYTQLKVVKVELFKNEADHSTTSINAKAPHDMPFGIWFQRLVADYNYKSPNSPIEPYNGSPGSGWIFYIKKSFFLPRKYIDFSKTFKENKIGEHNTIVAKRVQEQSDKNDK